MSWVTLTPYVCYALSIHTYTRKCKSLFHFKQASVTVTLTFYSVGMTTKPHKFLSPSSQIRRLCFYEAPSSPSMDISFLVENVHSSS